MFSRMSPLRMCENYGRFLLEHVDLGHRHARGDRHLLDDVAQPLARRVRGIAFDANPAQGLGDDGASAAQLR
jgi:hypothetical protein